MPSKIEIETIQCRKSRIWEMKGDKYLKGLTKDHVCAIFHMRDTLKNVINNINNNINLLIKLGIFTLLKDF